MKRISQKNLMEQVKYINSHVFKNWVRHNVILSFTAGCGVYTTIDGKEYYHLCKDGTRMGISNKKVSELLKPFWEEAIKQYEEENS